MKKIFTHSINIKKIALLIVFIFSISAKAQLPSCPDTAIYLQAGASIYKFYPNSPITASNPFIYLPGGGGSGLSLNNNLNGGPSPAFYTNIGGNYSWWNGAAWVNTGFSTGNPAAVNNGGGGCYIYNLVGGTGQVYRYDGTGPGTLITTISSFAGGGPYDIAADLDGNFYILRTQTPGQYLNMYNSSGTLLTSYTMTGMPSISAGGGFVVSGNKVYVFNTGGYFIGSILGSNINFTNIPGTLPTISDVAACPSLDPHTFGNNGPLSCSGGSVTLQSTGWAAGTTYSWTGPGVVGPTTNSTAIASAAGMYTCTITPPGGCATILTTSVASSGTIAPISINPSNPTICLGGSVTLTASGATNYTWSPSSSLSSANGSTVVASPSVSTTYTISATSGSCAATPQSIIVSVSLCTNINETAESLATLNLFPNPNNGNLTVKGSMEMNLNICDELGRVVKVLELNSENNYQTQVQGLRNGFYFLSDMRTGKAVNAKIVVIGD